MIVKTPPAIPFAGFKWRWASVAPTEGLNEQPVYLGVLRALRHHEGQPPSVESLVNELARVQKDTGTGVNLSRTGTRNLIRNSGQYWKALGLLESSQPVIVLSDFGRAVSDGHIAPSEFAATVVASLTLPNSSVQSDVQEWIKAGVVIKPLALILLVLRQLNKVAGHGFITKDELIKIVIPLSATNQNPIDHADTILAVRKKVLSVADWPNCVPAENDHRMAREFLIFLEEYGYCHRRSTNEAPPRDGYFLQDISESEVLELGQIAANSSSLKNAAVAVAKSDIPESTDRRRVLREVLDRPQQAKFRRDVFAQAKCQCAITGVRLEAALEAAHIVPVSKKGSDEVKNGLCLRSDIHMLFDCRHIRIAVNGALQLSDAAKGDPVYGSLPAKIHIPEYVSTELVEWRMKYW